MDIEETVELINQIENYRNYHRLEFYQPYDYQKKFHHARDLQNKLAVQRALMAANQIGKTFCGANESAMHLTGLYPKWWNGHKFRKPTEGLVASTTNETTRDRCQREMYGEPTDPNQLGTGSIPKDLIGETVRKPGVPNAFDSVLVKFIENGAWTGGWSKNYFRAYEQGPKKFMGYRIDWGWGDEEPPADVWSQMLRATFATDGILYITFTPEEGVTQVVYQFMNDLKPGQALIQATWDDAAHMTPEKQLQKLAATTEHEREMRSKGIPMVGSGLIFPVKEEEIKVPQFEIPAWWPRIVGADFGISHPFALAFCAFDRDTQTFYVYKTYRKSGAVPPVHAAAIGNEERWIPIAWPHDGLIRDKQSGKPLADVYRELGLNMLRDPFSNPPPPGQPEGKGGQGVEVGLVEMLTWMETGHFKVFDTCLDWFEEKRMYHRENGEVVKLYDDLMSATRYAFQMRRFVQTKPVIQKRQTITQGLVNW